MDHTKPPRGAWMINLGCVLFTLILLVSAIWQADIRWLHFFQAWMYLATIILVRSGSKWGLFVGFGAAVVWNYGSLFVNKFLKNGLHEVAQLIHTGHLSRPDQLIAVVAWIGNLLVIIGCIIIYMRRNDKRPADLWRLLLAFCGTTAFFALDMALFQPRYLAMFPRMLHPKLNL
jgi:hypothetical protein